MGKEYGMCMSSLQSITDTFVVRGTGKTRTGTQTKTTVEETWEGTYVGPTAGHRVCTDTKGRRTSEVPERTRLRKSSKTTNNVQPE